MSRDTRETVDSSYRYMVADALLDRVLEGEMNHDHALSIFLAYFKLDRLVEVEIEQ